MSSHKRTTGPEVSLFIPVYNEEKILKKNVTSVLTKLTELGFDFELFIIDDSSNDKSSLIARALSTQFKNVHHIRYENGPSRRENLAKSFDKAKGRVISYVDADLSTDFDSFSELITAVLGKYDIAIGNRYGKNSIVSRNFTRRIISLLFNNFIRLYFGSGISDHQCGFKAFKKGALMDLLDEMGYDISFKRKFFWDTELLLRARIKPYTIKEIAVNWDESKKSSFNIFEEMTFLPYMLGLKKRLHSGKREMSA